VTLGTVVGGVPAPSERAESSDEPDVAGAALAGCGTDVLVVVVVDSATAGALDWPPELGAAWPWRRSPAVAEGGAPPRLTGTGELVAIATRSAMRARDTARITHQLGRP
jgi:hypothetical protein